MAKAVKKTAKKFTFADLNSDMKGLSQGFLLEDSPFAKVNDWISTGNYILNAQISGDLFGGIPTGRITMLSGTEGCLHPSTLLDVSIFLKSEIPPDFDVATYDGFRDKQENITIGNLFGNYKLDMYRVFINSFDGFVEIINYYTKPIIQMYELSAGGSKIKVAENHKFETMRGWVFAKDIEPSDIMLMENEKQAKVLYCIKLPEKSFVLDFEVDHTNHRYFCQGFSNHNTGKTFIALNAAVQAQKKGYSIIWIDTEGALTLESAIKFGINTKKLKHEVIATVEEVNVYLKNMLVKLKEYAQEGTPPKIMIVLDSLGNLSTGKEMADTLSGSDKADMTRAKMLKKMFRVITADLGILQIPFVVINHVYDVIGSYYPTTVVGGGSGGKYNASTILQFSKSTLKDSSTKKVGIILKSRILKSRFTKGNIEARIHIRFDKGMNPYVGLDDYFDWDTNGIDSGKLNKGEFLPSPTAHGFAVKHLNKTFKKPLIFTKEVFTDEQLHIMNETIKPVFGFNSVDFEAELEDIINDPAKKTDE